jgi:hypothetical protein
MCESLKQYSHTIDVNFNYIIYLLLTRKLLLNMMEPVIYYQEKI